MFRQQSNSSYKKPYNFFYKNHTIEAQNSLLKIMIYSTLHTLEAKNFVGKNFRRQKFSSLAQNFVTFYRRKF